MTLTLAQAGWILGVVFGLISLAVLLFPEASRRATSAFPRHVWAGRILCAAALLMVCVNVYRADLGGFNGYKPLLYVLGPVSVCLVGWLLDERLAARALGGLLLLAANPLLAAARVENTPWRIGVSLVAYAVVLAGMMLVVGPHHFRRATQPALATRGRAALTGLVFLLLASAFIVLALGPYRTGG